MPTWIIAGGWGMLAASGLVLGALIGWFVPLSRRTVAAVMAFGSGVLIATVANEVMEGSAVRGGLLAASIGMFIGAVLFTAANMLLKRRGAAHRKRSGDQQHPAGGDDLSGIAIALGATMDGIPESLLLGLSLLEQGHIGVALLLAFFISNLPEGLSSAAGMRRAKRTAAYTFGVWGGLVLISGAAAVLGYAIGHQLSSALLAVGSAIAGGAILAMLADTMIPEAYDGTHDLAGIITVIGFLSAFLVSKTVG
jgi:zinc transporter, ZIP family